MAQQRPATIDDLGVTGVYYLAALLSAQERRLPIAPTRRLSLALMDTLRTAGVIDVPWPELRWPVCPDAEETPIERIQWRYAWPEYVRAGLVDALCDYLDGVTRDDYGLALRSRYWEELSVAEAERFFEIQLAKHQFDITWAQDFAFVHRDQRPALSIAQWRYCCWAATRHGASAAMQQRTSASGLVREAMYNELKLRAARLGTGAWSECAFPPANGRPDSALSRLFVNHLTTLGADFWTLLPDVDHIVFRSRPKDAAPRL